MLATFIVDVNLLSIALTSWGSFSLSENYCPDFCIEKKIGISIVEAIPYIWSTVLFGFLPPVL